MSRATDWFALSILSLSRLQVWRVRVSLDSSLKDFHETCCEVDVEASSFTTKSGTLQNGQGTTKFFCWASRIPARLVVASPEQARLNRGHIFWSRGGNAPVRFVWRSSECSYRFRLCERKSWQTGNLLNLSICHIVICANESHTSIKIEMSLRDLNFSNHRFRF